MIAGRIGLRSLLPPATQSASNSFRSGIRSACIDTVSAADPSDVLFRNVTVFEGKLDKLTGATPALVVGNKIEKIADDIAGRRKQLEMLNGRDLSIRLAIMHRVKIATAIVSRQSNSIAVEKRIGSELCEVGFRSTAGAIGQQILSNTSADTTESRNSNFRAGIGRTRQSSIRPCSSTHQRPRPKRRTGDC